MLGEWARDIVVEPKLGGSGLHGLGRRQRREDSSVGTKIHMEEVSRMAKSGQELTINRDVALIEAARTNHILLRTLGDLDEGELQRSPAGGLSPIIWQVGHIASSDAFFARLCGHTFAPDAAFEALFGRRTGGVKPYPPRAEVTLVYEAARAALESVARTADLSQPVEYERFKTVGDVLSFAYFHRGYHIGKICTLRALLSKPRLFE